MSELQKLSEETGVSLFVPGRPRTKGSLKPVHIRMGAGRCRVSLTESGEYAAKWKQTMMAAVRAACVCERYAGAVRVDTFFRFEKLCVPDQALPWPTRETGEYAHGDEDKLRRNALDALTQSGLIFDDSLVVGGQNWKRWTPATLAGHVPIEEAGVLIVVTPAPGVPAVAEREREALTRLDALRPVAGS
jgi:Holliday junction resolvase RusA-like endonuclease